MKVKAVLGAVLVALGFVFAPKQDAEPQVPSDVFYINFEIIALEEQVESYPKTWEMFNEAMNEWAQRIPVRWKILTPEVDILSLYNHNGVIVVQLGDLQNDEYGYPAGLLGLWDPYMKSILLDAERLESNEDQAFNVSLHEIGHMFGLPHIAEHDEHAFTGWLVLPEGKSGKNYVMYPRASVHPKRKSLSLAEIDIALNNLVYRWTEPYAAARCEFHKGK